MIDVKIYRGGESAGAGAADTGAVAGNGRICKIAVSGHAGFAAHGEDIVCAAASVTMYTAAGALRILCGAPESCSKERDGYFELEAPAFADGAAADRADTIMEAAYIGFMQIEASYGEFLKVTEYEGGKKRV